MMQSPDRDHPLCVWTHVILFQAERSLISTQHAKEPQLPALHISLNVLKWAKTYLLRYSEDLSEFFFTLERRLT